MRILLINPVTREYQRPYSFPIGLGILAAIMRDRGHDVIVYDQNALRTTFAEMLRVVARLNDVDVVATGGLITTYAVLKTMIPGLRDAFPGARIVVGGGVTVEPDVVFANIPADFCVHGEGEHTFPELCDAIAAGARDFSHIDGISYLGNERIVTTRARAVERNLDTFPMPAYDLFPSELYFSNNLLRTRLGFDVATRRSATILWSRGCPYQCSFCWRMMGPGTRFRAPDLVCDEIRHLRSHYGVDSYLFVDECINANKGRTKLLFDRLIEDGLEAPWYSAARVNLFDEEIASLFQQSGCVGLNFGVESASPEMLKAMNKKATPEQASTAVRLAKQNGIDPICTFILGMPGETTATIEESVRWIRKNKVDRVAFYFATPFPGCDLYKQPVVMDRIVRKFRTKDRYFSMLGDVDVLAVNLTDFSDAELIKLHRNARLSVSLFAGYQWIRLLKNPGRWVSAVRKLFGVLTQPFRLASPAVR